MTATPTTNDATPDAATPVAGHHRRGLPTAGFPVDPWRLVETGFHPELAARTETLFALANGYLGVRAVPEEGDPLWRPGVLINGFHETWPIVYPEAAFGLASEGQTIVDVSDPVPVAVRVDGELLAPGTARLVEHARSIDFRSGVLERRTVWQASGGATVEVVARRLVSLQDRHLIAASITVRVDREAELRICSGLRSDQVDRDPTVTLDPRAPRRGAPPLQRTGRSVAGARIVSEFETGSSKMGLACGIDHRLYVDGEPADAAGLIDDNQVAFSIDSQPGVTIPLEKFAAYHTKTQTSNADLATLTDQTLDSAMRSGFEHFVVSQEWYLGRFWDNADVVVDGDPMSQQAIRWNLFQLAQATIRNDGDGIAAKGLTGSGYEGHYFWDTDIFVAPFLAHTNPTAARELLQFRYRMLDAARERAREVNQVGALFPWRTINGREASAMFESGTAQYHINADIAHALIEYVAVTGDRTVLAHFGAEILVETARLWVDLGFFAPDGRFHIHGVTGPDEYTTVVDDNTYTNLMAQQNLRAAVDAVEELRTDHLTYEQLAARIQLDPEEATKWRRAADAMYIPFDEVLGIHPQNDRFLHQEPWDFAGTPKDQYPLLLHFHPLVIYRHQVLKQSDVVMATYLLPDQFTENERRRNFDYYEPLTTDDSSLSHCVQSIVATGLDQADLGWAHFTHTAFMDLGDIAGNTADGTHLAATAGTWLCLIHGFAGLSRRQSGNIHLEPRLPAHWERLEFNVHLDGQVCAIEITHDTAAFELVHGGPLTVTVNGTAVVLTSEQQQIVPLTNTNPTAHSNPEKLETR